MTENERFLYIKFLINRKKDIPQGFFLSEELASVQDWDGSSKSEQAQTKHEATIQSSSFKALSREFVASADTYQRGTPFLMMLLPS